MECWTLSSPNRFHEQYVIISLKKSQKTKEIFKWDDYNGIEVNQMISCPPPPDFTEKDIYKWDYFKSTPPQINTKWERENNMSTLKPEINKVVNGNMNTNRMLILWLRYVCTWPFPTLSPLSHLIVTCLWIIISFVGRKEQGSKISKLRKQHSKDNWENKKAIAKNSKNPFVLYRNNKLNHTLFLILLI